MTIAPIRGREMDRQAAVASSRSRPCAPRAALPLPIPAAHCRFRSDMSPISDTQRWSSTARPAPAAHVSIQRSNAFVWSVQRQRSPAVKAKHEILPRCSRAHHGGVGYFVGPFRRSWFGDCCRAPPHRGSRRPACRRSPGWIGPPEPYTSSPWQRRLPGSREPRQIARLQRDFVSRLALAGARRRSSARTPCATRRRKNSPAPLCRPSPTTSLLGRRSSARRYGPHDINLTTAA